MQTNETGLMIQIVFFVVAILSLIVCIACFYTVVDDGVKELATIVGFVLGIFLLFFGMISTIDLVRLYYSKRRNEYHD